MEHYILNDDGSVTEEPDLMTWARWYETAERHVALDRIGLNVKVSTVFLGLDHSFGSGAPLLFETMVFGGPLDSEQDRYSTKDDALAGHARILAQVNAALEASRAPAR